MTKTLLMAAIGLATVLSGCNKIKQLANINVDIPYNTQIAVPEVQGYTTGITLPAGGLELPSVTVAVPTNSQAYLSQYGTAANMVVDVYLKSLSVQIASPAGVNFNFLDNMQVYISAKSLPELEVASVSNIPAGSTTLNLTCNTDVNLKNYYLADTVYLRMAAHINSVPPAGEQLNITSTFHLTANPLN